MENDDRDIVLILGSGGMMGIFTAGVLEVIDRTLENRVHSVYATSSGADVGAYFVSGQSKIPRRFFLDYLAAGHFIRRNWLAYCFKIFFARRSRIPDFLNLDYVIDTARSSACAIDMDRFAPSSVRFFVKVINLRNREAVYLDAKENLFEKLRATSQCGPFTSSAVVVDGEQYIDGDTNISDLDENLVRSMPEKRFIYIEPVGPESIQKIFLYPFYVVAGLAIMRLYSVSIGARYMRELFKDRALNIVRYPNVTYIKNQLDTSIFCTDATRLDAVHRHGVEEAERILRGV